METTLYNTRDWADAREYVLARDGRRCSVARLLGGACSDGPLHVHHIVRPEDGGAPYDPDNLGSTCSRHHPVWAKLRRALQHVRHSDLQADLQRRARLVGLVRNTGHAYLRRDMEELLSKLGATGEELEDLLALADTLRERHEGERVAA